MKTRLLSKIVIILVVSALAVLTGCSSHVTSSTIQPAATNKKTAPPKNSIDIVADEKKIEEDLGINTAYGNKDIPIKVVEIIKRQTNKENKQDLVFCQVTSENSKINLISYYKLTYNFYDVGGWILDEATTDRTDEWNFTPLVGIDEEEIKLLLISNVVTVDGLWEHIGGSWTDAIFSQALWEIEDGEIDSMTITDHISDFANKTDHVKGTISLHSENASISGSVEMIFELLGPAWSLASFSPSTFSIVSSQEFAVTDNKIFEDIKSYYPDIGKKYMIGFETHTNSEPNIHGKWLCDRGSTMKVFVTWQTMNPAGKVETNWPAVMFYSYTNGNWSFTGGEWADKSGPLKKMD